MAQRAPEFVAALVDPRRVSPRRLDDAITRACPQAWDWCARAVPPIARPAYAAALIGALPGALQLTWPECLRRAGQRGALARAVRAEFRPWIEVFDGRGQCHATPLRLRVDIAPVGAARPAARITARVTLSMAIGHHAATAAEFFELARDLVLSAP